MSGNVMKISRADVFHEYQTAVATVRRSKSLLPRVIEIAGIMVRSLRGGGTIFLFGNGGSASDADTTVGVSSTGGVTLSSTNLDDSVDGPVTSVIEMTFVSALLESTVNLHYSSGEIRIHEIYFEIEYKKASDEMNKFIEGSIVEFTFEERDLFRQFKKWQEFNQIDKEELKELKDFFKDIKNNSD